MSTNEGQPIETEQKLDEFGRIDQASADASLQYHFEAVRPLIDANTKITPFDEQTKESKTTAIQLAKYMVATMSTTQRKDVDFITKASNKIFRESLNEDLTVTIFMDAIRTIPANTDTVAALIGHYTTEFKDALKTNIITKLIPEEIQNAFKNDQFTTVKRMLYFLGFFVSYNLVTPDSYLKLINALADKVQEASSDFRVTALCHAVLFACRTAPEEINDEDINTIIEKIRPFVNKSFIAKFFPCDAECALGAVELLLNCTRFESKCKDYSELFLRASSIDIPDITLEFGAKDLAPPPTVYITTTYTAVQEYFPVLLDIASDYIVYLGSDPEVTAHQYLALPMIEDLPSLKSENATYDINIHSPFVEAVFTSLFSDLIRLPYSTRHIQFYVSTLSHMVKARAEIVDTLKNVVSAITSLPKLDFGSLNSFIKVISHFVTNTKLHVMPLDLEEWRSAAQLETQDIRKIFIESFIKHVYYYSTFTFIQLDIPEEMKKFIPERVKNGDNATDAVKNIRSVIEGDRTKINDELTAQISKFGEFEMLNNLIKAVVLNTNFAEQAIRQIEEYSTLIFFRFDSSKEEDAWKAEVFVESIFTIFENSPTTIAQIITHLIEKTYITLTPFLKWFLSPATKKKLDNMVNWDIFHNIMDSIFKYYSITKRYKEMYDGMIQLYEKVIELVEEVHDTLSERILLGNIGAFTLRHMEVFKGKCEFDIQGPNFYKAKKEFIDFFNRIQCLCQ